MTKDKPMSIIDYWHAVDEAFLKLFAIESTDAGIGPDLITAAKKEGQMPEEFAIRCGEKYGLNTIT